MNGRRAYHRPVKAIVEHELKLDVDVGFELPGLPGEQLQERTFTSTYHDTPVRSLARAGITLRLRVEDGRRSVWQLKLPRSDAARSEIEEEADGAELPEPLARLLLAHLRHGAVEPVAVLRTVRAGVRVADGARQVADVTVDTVDVRDGEHAGETFAEVEAELVDGDEADLERLGRILRGAGARASDGTPKLLRVLDLPATSVPARDAPLSEHLRAMLEAQLLQLEAHDPGVRLGADPEDVHRFRVATRRTRALARETRSLLGGALSPLAEELRFVAGVLGPVRDLDVLIEHLGGEVDRLDEDEQAGQELLRVLEGERETAREALLDALASERYGRLLDDFDAAVATPAALARDAAADDVARAAFRRLQQAAGSLEPEPADAALHELRIKAKRARYAAELAGLRGGKAVERAIAALKKVQDVAGEHQDAVVAEARLRGLARPATALAAGRLIERERLRRRTMRAALPDTLADALAAGERAFP